MQITGPREATHGNDTSPRRVPEVYLNASTEPGRNAVPLSPFMVHVWRQHQQMSEAQRKEPENRERFLYWFYDAFHPMRTPYMVPVPFETLRWLNQPEMDVGAAFRRAEPDSPGQKYYLTRYMVHVWKQNRRELDASRAESYLRFLAWFALEFIPAQNLPARLIPDDLVPLLNQPVRPPLPLTCLMRVWGELRGALGAGEARTVSAERVVALSFELLPDLLHAGDPRLVPETVSRFWSAKMSGEPWALTAYEYFAAQGCCPDLLSTDTPDKDESKAVRHWCATQFRVAIPKADIFFSTLPETFQDEPDGDPLDTPEKAIYLYRDHHTIAGLSKAGRIAQQVLTRAGFHVIDLDFLFSRANMPDEYASNQRSRRFARSALHILNINPESVPECLMCHLSVLDERSYIIGQFYWELSDIGVLHECGLSLVNEIWVASEYLRDVYRKRVSVPIYVMGQAVEIPVVEKQYGRTAFDLPEGAYLFLFSFDAGSVVERKNPLAALRAFQKAFPKGNERAGLVLKVRNIGALQTERDRDHWRQVVDLASRDRRIQIIDRTMSFEEMTGLFSVCDCYISLHRSEGFGYGPADAMGLGKPVITTAYSGVTDFCTPKTSLLVDYDLERVPQGAYPYMDEFREYYWAAPKIGDAASQMRRLYDDPSDGQRIGQCGREFIEQHYSTAALQRRYLARLAELGWY